MSIKYSLVIPMKNEEGNVVALIEELQPIMENLKESWELLCIDDGSTDKTLALLNELALHKPFLRVIAFAGNFGQSSAFDAGFKLANGAFIITLDGDRQNDPADIPKLIEAMTDADLVCGIRQKRNDPWHRRAISYFANKIRGRFCQDGMRDTGCSLKIYRKTCLQQIKMFHGMHRFLPALFKIEGFRLKQIPVNHRERTQGKTKYNIFNRSFNTLADMMAVRWMYNRRLKYKIKQGTHD